MDPRRGNPMQPSEGGLRQRVAFRTHPAQIAEGKSVEQPWFGYIVVAASKPEAMGDLTLEHAVAHFAEATAENHLIAMA
jgi:hypothetical protein